MTGFADSDAAMVWVARLSAVSVIISTLEYMAVPTPLKDDGLMSWEVGSVRQPWLASGRTATVLNLILSYPNVLWLLALRLIASVAILVGPPAVVTRPALTVPVVVLSGLFMARNFYGQDGADQMVWIVFVAMAMAGLVGTRTAKAAFLWFVALQSCLSYGVAGLAKASAAGWRDGTFLVGVCSTQIYGYQAVGTLLRARPALACLLSRSLVTWESLFPLVLVVPRPISLAMLASGVAFHVLNAYVMGLNTFVWSFVAGYPAILYCISARGW